MQALAEQSRIVRLPLNQVGSLNKISKAFSKFEQENERRPSPEELADELEIPVDKISDTLKVSGRHISVDAPFVEGEDNSLLDVLVNDDSPMADRSLVNESLAREIDRALSTLTEREKEIIQMFFGIGQQEMTLEEIGDKFGLTRERVRQIKEKAIRRLRQSQWFSDLGIYRDEPTEEGLALPDLVRYVRECIPGASGFTMDDFLNQDTEILQEPDRDPDCDLLFDATKLVMRCPALHNGYNQNDAQCMIELERQGISAGIVFFTVAPEVSEADKTQLREALATLLKDPERQDAFLCTGFGSALRYEYVEGLFWDSKTIFDLLLEWFKSQPKIKQAAFHSFLRICGSGIFKSPDQDETETSDGSDTSEEVVR